MPQRQLTVSRLYPNASHSGWQSLRRGGRGRDGDPVPFLRLAGRWLSAAGFAPGERVSVQVEEGRLVIEPLES